MTTNASTARFLNVHILHVLPFSNPNRDDTGSPKTLVFGGEVRGRMSSQSQKRAARHHFEGLSPADKTSRSKYAGEHLADKVTTILEANGVRLDDAQHTKMVADIKKELGKLTGSAEDAKDTLVWIAEEETNTLAGTLASKHAATQDVTLEKADIDGALTDSTDSLTIAAFGRMFANRPDLQIEAATQVAHAMTTHGQQVDLDYFTAADDLQASFDTPDEDGKTKGSGAGHLDLNEFHSGVFYRYFNVNRADLVANWTPMRDGDMSQATADRVRQFLEAMIRQLPTGRDATAAHQNAPATVLVTFSDHGDTYASAFETPVQAGTDGGHLPVSADTLAAFHQKMERVDGAVPTLRFDLHDDTTSSLIAVLDAATQFIVTGNAPASA